MRLILFRELLSGNKGHFTEVALTFEPLLPSFPCVNDQVFLEPLLVLKILLFEENVAAINRVSILFQE